jgi:hypothetical protein
MPAQLDRKLDTFITVGRLFFAVSLAGFGALHLVAGDFVTGRAPPWPEPLPGRMVWAWGTGVVLIGAGGAVAAAWHGRLAAVLAGTLVLGWALLRNVPPTVASELLSPQWTNAGKALVLGCGAFAVGGSLPATGANGAFGRSLDTTTGFMRLGSTALGLFMVLCGIQHFKYDGFVASLVPGWIPGAYFWTYSTGLALIAFGTGLVVPRTARTAAALSGTMIWQPQSVP